MKRNYLVVGLAVVLGIVAAGIVGCVGSGSSAGATSLGGLIGGRQGQLVDAGLLAGSAVTISAEQEDELGRTITIAATNQWPLYDNSRLTRYVTLVGLTLTSASSRPDGNWVFGILDTPHLGAYSGPNGYILITRGSLAAMQDEAELAGVLAHEIAHVLNHDGLEAVKNARLTQAGMQAASAGNRNMEQFNAWSGELVQTVLKSGWSQKQESKADKDAVKLLIASGYDAAGLPRFLSRMQKDRGSSRGGGAFSTHPGTAERIERTTSQIGYRNAGATNPDRFAKYASEAKLGAVR